MATKPLPTIQKIKLSKLEIDYSLSGRTMPEIKEAAKDFIPGMKEFGWDARQPGEVYIDPEGKIHLVAGFCRYTSAVSAGQEYGYFFESDTEPSKLALRAILTNKGHSLSQFGQGEIFAKYKNGRAVILVDPEKGDDDKGKRGDFGAPFESIGAANEAKKDGDVIYNVGAPGEPQPANPWIEAPMSAEELGAAAGITATQVMNCICVFESPEEIAQGIIEQKWSANAVLTAKRGLAKYGKDGEVPVGLWKKILNAALANAKENDKTMATDKHVHAVKESCLPEKKLKAAPANGSSGENSGTATASEGSGKGNAAPDTEKPATASASASTEAPSETPSPENGDLELGFTSSLPHDVPKDKEKTQKALEGIIAIVSEERGLSMDDADIEYLAQSIIAAKLPF